MSSRLECRNLTKDYGNVMALSDVNLTLESGRIVGLLGPNGSGKTTLIKTANGLLQPTSGEILLNGLKPGPETKSFVSYLPDANYLPDWMNIDGLVGMFADFYADFDRKKAEEMLSAALYSCCLNGGMGWGYQKKISSEWSSGLIVETDGYFHYELDLLEALLSIDAWYTEEMQKLENLLRKERALAKRYVPELEAA